MSKLIKKLLEKPTALLLLATWLFYLSAIFLFNHVVWDENLYHLQWTGMGSFETYLASSRKMDFIFYFLSPLYVLAIIFIVWVALKIGMVFSNEPIADLKLLKISIISSNVLFLSSWSSVIWFLVIKNGYTPDEVKYFNPLSVLVFFNNYTEWPMAEIKAWRFINIFQILFIVFLAYCLKYSTKLRLGKAFLLVLLTYGIGLVLMVAVRLVIM
ncbi:MAG: hypothetical protein WC780_02920 [Lentimicrobiaceae bacterium]|jgi:hypothetical protein